jgi:hypothetical protein
MPEVNRYTQIIERIFFAHYKKGGHEVTFDRDEIAEAAEALGIKLPKNLGDLIYTFRYRGNLPESICSLAPEGNEWVIMPAGRSRYRFVATSLATILPSNMLAETKVPDATPGIISRYALNDEQALLAKLRYNRLIDVFTGVTCYSLQNHLRTAVTSFGQVETDEVYVGIDKRGAQYVFPVQAKGIRDTLRIVQIAQDLAMCAAKFPSLICRPIAAQLMADGVITVFEFEQTSDGILISAEKHYRLVPPDEVTDEDLRIYRGRQQ